MNEQVEKNEDKGLVVERDLDARYGAVRSVTDKVKQAERDHRPGTRQMLDDETAPVLRNYMQSALDGVKFSTVLHSTIPILWAVDPSGHLWFAIEEVVDTKNSGYLFPYARNLKLDDDQEKLGHPSVVGGAEARLGGEIMFDSGFDRPVWVLNNKSGRFGYGDDRKKEHLETVQADLGHHGIHVVVDFVLPVESRREI